VPHDTEINDHRRQLLRASIKPDDTNDSSPDRLGDTSAVANSEPATDVAAALADNSLSAANTTKPSAAHIVPASLKPKGNNCCQTPQATDVAQNTRPPESAGKNPLPPIQRGTMVVDLGGSTVAPSLLGLPVRTALETAQQAGVEIDIVGSGVAREQFPPPGARLAPGAHVSVRFAR
jgi:cell division protein FtsI (penicillin-binding protein 3)